MTDNTFAALNLTGNPFSMATSRDGFYHTLATRMILDELAHGIETRKGFMVLIGEVGVGKTSLSLQLFAMLEGRNAVFAWIFNPMFTKEELFRAIAGDFGLACERDFSLLDYQQLLHNFFLATYSAGKTSVIVVDEAHNLSDESLEALRMLGNFEFDGQKLVQVILIAQPELAHRLERDSMRQLKSRVSIYQVLPQFNRQELIGYVNFKLNQGGSQLRLAGLAAWLLWRATRGNLRLAKLIMERALYGCLAFGSNTITARIMRLAVHEVRGCAGIARHADRRVSAALGIALAGLMLAGLGVMFAPGLDREWITTFMTPKNTSMTSPPDTTLPAKRPSTHNRESIQQAVATFEILAGKPLGPELPRALEQAVNERKPEILLSALPPTVAMAVLENLPEQPGTNPNWLAMAWPTAMESRPAWLVFWSSEFPIDTPAPGQTSPMVLLAQHRLRELGFLTKPASGLLNSPTWYAIGDFQRSVGLPVTGVLDPATYFWLRFPATSAATTHQP